MNRKLVCLHVGLSIAVAGCTVTLVDERTRTDGRDGGSTPGRDGGCPGCPPPGVDADLPDGSLPPLDNGIRLVTEFGGGLPGSRAMVDGSGTCAAFAWQGHEIVENRDRGMSFVYVVDLATGELELVSVNDAGNPQPDGSFEPQHSVGDGGNDRDVDAVVSDGCERVVFASNQILDDRPGVTERGGRVYLRDRAAGTTRQLGPTHGEFGDAHGLTPSIGREGDQIVLVTSSYYFSPGSVTNNVLALADPSGSAEWLQLTHPEMALDPQPNATEPVVAADGQYALARVSYFETSHGNSALARVDLGTGALHDIVGNQPEPVVFFAYRISADGSVVVFTSDDEDIGDSAPEESGMRLYVVDVEADTIEWINRDEAGGLLSINNFGVGLSDDGRYLVYEAFEGRTEDDRTRGIYRYDIETSEHRLLTTSYGGMPSDASCTAPGISADGRTVAFYCSSYGNDLPLTTAVEEELSWGFFVWEE